ncbi:MAG TPA: TlpA disulfide reductase family protein, partial [Bdellovibrio sp.]|nr:TlpA disulfide reductase family protein [Bdellovibrio sp.]
AQATSLDIQFKEITAEPLNKTSALKMEDLKGKVVLVDFWASWCEPCKEALPHYEKLYQKYKGKGLVILGINEDDDMKDRDAFLKAHPLSFPVFFDKEKKMANAFGVAALPTLFVFDKNLKATDLFRGFDEKKTASLEKKISTLLSEKK